MKDYLFMLMGFGSFFVIFFGIELNKDNVMLQQIFAVIGYAIFAFSFVLDCTLDMYEEKKKKKKEED